MNATKIKPVVIGFGLGGHSFNYTSPGYGNCSLSGYDRPERFEQELVDGKKSYDDFDLSGVPVVDKRAVLEVKPGLAIRSPMVDACLQPDEIDGLNKDAAARMMPGLSGGFEVFAAMGIAHDGPEPGPMDMVGINIYLNWWRKQGARIGKMDSDGKRIIWE